MQRTDGVEIVEAVEMVDLLLSEIICTTKMTRFDGRKYVESGNIADNICFEKYIFARA